MRKRSFLLVAVALLATGRTAAAAEGTGPSGFVPLRGSVHPLARPEEDLGRADPRLPMRGASIAFARSPEQQAALEVLLAEQRDPSSPRYRSWLSPEEFRDRFGARAEDVEKVAAWLRSQGFTVDGTSRSRTWLRFSGTFGQVESAFHTEMHWYRHRGETHFANAGELSVPLALRAAVLGVRHLDDFRPRPRIQPRPRPDFTLGSDHFLAPEDVALIYDLAPLYAIGLDGTGQRIAVAGQTEIDPLDVQAFRSASGLRANSPDLVLVPGSGDAAVRDTDLPEADLDVEWSGAVAPNAQIVYVYTGSSANYDVFDSVAYAVDMDLAPVLSVSYGGCEAGVPASFAEVLRALAQQGNAQGQTLLSSSGDAGAADCDGVAEPTATEGLAVDFPASMPEFTGVGGTEFTGDVSSPGSYWNGSNDASNGSALAYIPEAVWNESAASQTLAASGGGASVLYAQPSWQVGPGVPAAGTCPLTIPATTSCRYVPDVALAAAAGHDGYILCTGGSCASGFATAVENKSVVGGTSASVQAFAGILAIVNQAVGAGGLGNANAALYQLADSTPAAFHAISTGSNEVPCTAGSADCPASGSLGFSATGAYSEATGLGSVDAQELVLAWVGSANRYLLTVATGGTGAGTVSGGGIACATGSASGCTASQVAGGTVTLTAAPTPGSGFAGWSGAGCTGVGSCTLTVSQPESVLASFQANPAVPFFVVKAGPGSGTVTSSPAGIFCGSTCSATFSKGLGVTFAAVPAAGSTFAGWAGAGCAGKGSCTTTIAAAPEGLTATFSQAAPAETGTALGCGTAAGDGGERASALFLALFALAAWRRRAPRTPVTR